MQNSSDQNSHQINLAISSNPPIIQFQNFIFPVQLIQTIIFRGKKELKKCLSNEYQLNPQYPRMFNLIQRQSRKGRVATLTCRFCQIKIKYAIISDDIWVLTQYQNNHTHYFKQNNTKSYKNLEKKVIIQNIEKPQQNKNIKQTNRDTLSNKFKQMKQMVLRQKSNDIIFQILTKLKYNIKYLYHPLDSRKKYLPDYLVATSIRNTLFYQKYGEVIYYDIIYNCTQQNSYQGNSFSIGVLTGQDNGKNLLLFGFTIISRINKVDFKKLFELFFELMGTRHTSCIVTGQQINIGEAISELSKQKSINIAHIYDIEIFLKSIKQRMGDFSNQQKNEQIIKIQKVLKQSDPLIGESLLNNLENVLVCQKKTQIVSRIKQNKRKVCLFAMSNNFVGLWRQKLKNIKIYDSFKSGQSSILKFIKQYQRQSQQTIKNYQFNKLQIYQFEILFEDYHLKTVRQKLKKNIFKIFISYYRKIQCYHFESRSAYQFIIINFITKLRYTVNIQTKTCICQLIQKIGMPCEHLIFVIKEFLMNKKYKNENIMSYEQFINQRWLKEYDSSDQQSM